MGSVPASDAPPPSLHRATRPATRPANRPADPRADPALVDHLVAGTGLSPAEVERVVQDVLAFHAEQVAHYVRRRHAELKTYGARNDDIFRRLAVELEGRVVAAPRLSERQLRRLVYG